jgi:spore germination protein
MTPDDSTRTTPQTPAVAPTPTPAAPASSPPAPAPAAKSRRWVVALVALAAVVIAALAVAGIVRHFTGRDMGPPFTGVVSGPGNGRHYRATAWSRGAAAPIDAAIAAGGLDEVDFDWYLAQADGSIVPEHENLDLVRHTRERGLQAFATVVNRPAKGAFSGDVAAAILATPESRRRHVAALVALAVDKGYDGIDVDWEAIPPADRDRFSQFVEELARALHDKHRLLSIAVFPKTSEPGQWDLQKPYDYARLGAVVDEFKIMTYSFSGPWGEPGPQMPLDWAGDVLTFAAGLVPPGKTYLGLPFYGFDWHGESTTAVHSNDARDLRTRYDPQVRRDTASNEAVMDFTDENGLQHVVYFQDQTAIAAKIKLLRASHPGLAGVAAWELLDEDPGFWKVIARGLR